MKVKLTLSRDTKGTFVYKDDSDEAPIPSLYIKRSAVKKGEPPKTITVDIPEIK